MTGRKQIERALEDALAAVRRGRTADVYSFAREAADLARAGAAKPLRVAAVNRLETDTRYSQSLERGLLILGLFTEADPIWRLADIADRLGFSRSTTHRYMLTLVALGQLEQTTGRRYRRKEAS